MERLRFGQWWVIGELGQGRQGVVYAVRANADEHARNQDLERYLGALRTLLAAAGVSSDDADVARDTVRQSMAKLASGRDASPLGALKRLHVRTGSEGDKARRRFEQEIEALSLLKGAPGIIELLDHDASDVPWIVTRLYPGGTLAGAIERYQGKALAALSALRPLVSATSMLHQREYVHRDVKPANIFLDEDERLVLGDFGIVFSPEGDRPTSAHERVGTRDWMPPWYHTGERIDAVKPDFDVFALGKVLWCMVAGRAVLPYWNWASEKNNLETLFSDSANEMRIVNGILERTVVGEEQRERCYSSATELLDAIDQAIERIERGGQTLRPGVERRCLVCGQGTYEPRHNGDLLLLGLPLLERWPRIQALAEVYSTQNRATVRVERCTTCGHLQFFNFRDGVSPEAWGADGQSGKT